MGGGAHVSIRRDTCDQAETVCLWARGCGPRAVQTSPLTLGQFTASVVRNVGLAAACIILEPFPRPSWFRCLIRLLR